jgi:inhibitor of KinA sporulation pathway (predicted exonuclease)
MPKNKREIIEIGAVKIQNGEIVDKFQCFVKPQKNTVLTEYCKQLTHIQQEDVDNAESIKEALDKFIEWVNNATLASWGDFDTEIVNKELHKLKSFKNVELCFINIKRVYLALFKLPSKSSLIECLRKEKITFDGNQHRAYDDAYNTYLIYKKHCSKMDEMMKQFYPRSYFEIGKEI